jgi:hypothetical protein
MVATGVKCIPLKKIYQVYPEIVIALSISILMLVILTAA